MVFSDGLNLFGVFFPGAMACKETEGPCGFCLGISY